MSTTPSLEVSPASPASGDAVLLTASGTVPEGSTIVVEGDDGIIATSVPFGLGDIPLGTGDSKYTLRITGGTSGTFALDVYAYGDGIPSVDSTDPIYYYNDAPTYAYPDNDDLADAIEAALPGADVTVSNSGPTRTVLIGGKYSGRRVSMVQGTTAIGGSETVTLTEITKTAGPFVFGPLVLTDDDYVAYLYDDDGLAIGNAVEFTLA